MKPAVGFQFGTFMDGHTTVGTPELCYNIPRAAKAAAQLLTGYLQDEKNKVPAPYSKLDSSGFWRLLLVRTSLSGETLVSLQVNSSQVSTEEYARIKQDIVKLFLDTTLEFGLCRRVCLCVCISISIYIYIYIYMCVCVLMCVVVGIVYMSE
jgi:hypothetical protein